MARTRVVVWGPGSLGGACIRELMRLPEFALVGVLAFDARKHGRDAGELVGIAPIGVNATTNKDEIIAMDADCVLHTPRAEADFRGYDTDVIRLLESGKDVISSACYHFPLIHGEEYVSRLEAACRHGGSHLHGTGIHPGFFLERMAVTATGLSNRIERIRAREVTDCSKIQSRPFMEAFGFGADPTLFCPNGLVAQLTDRYFHETVSYIGHTVFGRLFDRIDKESSFVLAPRDTEISCMTILRGMVSTIQYVFTGILNGAARVRLEQHWYVSSDLNQVADADSPHYWDLEVEGQPCSLRVRIDASASIRNHAQQLEGDPTMLTFYATAVPMIQAITSLRGEPPGIVYSKVFAHHRGT